MKGRSRTVLWWSTGAFVLLSVAAGAGLLLPFDLWTERIARTFSSEPLDRAGVFFSTLGSLEVSTALFGLLVLAMFLRGDRRLATRIAVAFGVTAAIEVSMKLFLPVPPISEGFVRRTDFAPLFDGALPYPYPSGHMLRTTILLGTLCLSQRSGLLWSVSLVLLGMMGVSRVYLGVHWPSDVVGGTLLGIAGVAWAYGGRKTWR